MFSLKIDQIVQNINQLKQWLKAQKLDGLYVSSYDSYLNEYVPLKECHRYYVTGFTGSVAEVLVLSEGPVLLFVDGRYHEQADAEVALGEVEVIKCSLNDSLEKRLLGEIKSRGLKAVGYEGERCRYQFQIQLGSVTGLRPLDNEELFSVINFERETYNAPVEMLTKDYRDRSVTEKIKSFLSPGQALFICALDELAWLCNARSYGIPFQSTFAAKGLAVYPGGEMAQDGPRLIIFLTSHQRPDAGLEREEAIHFVDCADDKGLFLQGPFLSQLEKVKDKGLIDSLFVDESQISSRDMRYLRQIFDAHIKPTPVRINDRQSIKSNCEIKAMEEAFAAAMTAKHKTFQTALAKVQKSQQMSELDFKRLLEDNYKNEGARAQSFQSIVGFAGNGSIIHYSSPSPKCQLTTGELLLVDSGGFFAGGLATDCTRTMHTGGPVSEEQSTLYTLVLKGLLQCQHAVFPAGTWGCQLDALARAPMRRRGFDYAHGTGHGVGVNVHEPGFRLSPTSKTPLLAGQVGSIEPGIYLPGHCGVRLENVVTVQEHPDLEGMLHFRPLNYLGYDTSLINRDMLDEDELRWLSDYQEICRQRGVDFPES